MKKGITLKLVLLFLLFIPINALGQAKLLDKYRFEDGGYLIIGIFSHHDDHPLQKKIGEFYTNDVSVLNALKKAWVFRRPQKDYACGYHYQILVLKDRTVQGSFVINLECNQLRTNEASLYFDLRKLEDFSSKFKSLRREYKTFGSIAEARRHLASIRISPSFVYVREPRWAEFEGEFRFNLKSPLVRNGNSSEFEAIKSKLEAEIRAAYPGEAFELSYGGGATGGDLFVTIKCNASLEQKFALYDRWNKTAFGRWEAYYLDLYSYWEKP